MTLKHKIGSVVAAGAIYAAMAVPAFADTTVNVSDNGFGSKSQVVVSQTSSLDVSQQNNTEVTNKVNVVANTGGNSASGNTGGNTDMTSGDVVSSVSIRNSAGNNSFSFDGMCDCMDGGNVDVTVSDNGAFSNTGVGYQSSSAFSLSQTNDTSFSNHVNSWFNTGWNSSSFNTGDGENSLTSGNVGSMFDLFNRGGHNMFE